MGKTIHIVFGEPTTTSYGLTVWPGGVHLCPAGGGGWNLFDRDLPYPAAEYADLETAVRAVDAYISAKKRALQARGT